MVERRSATAINRDKSPHSKALRQSMTEAELRLWSNLRAGRLQGHKFRRQVPIGPYVVDFLCVRAKLVIEADGGQHSEDVDRARTRFLEAQGYRVIRFWNNAILSETDGVMTAILEAVERR